MSLAAPSAVPPGAVSVIIPVYQSAATIGRAIESVLQQSAPAREIIIIDDGSTDDLDSALAPFRDNIIFIRKSNSGAADARNMGIARARGDFIALLDADDMWLPSKLERQLDVFERWPEVGIVSTAWFQQPLDGPKRLAIRKLLAVKRFIDHPLSPSRSRIVEVAARIWTSTVMIRRSALGDDRFLPNLRMCDDRDLYLRLMARTSAYIISEPLATVFLVPGSLSRTPANLDSDCRELLWVDRRNAALVDARGRRRSRAFVYRKWARGHLRAGRPKAALKPACARLRVEPFSPHAWLTAFKIAVLSLFSRE